jgi:ubiquinone/menaquinone biosynthesis C-methylase UbiE
MDDLEALYRARFSHQERVQKDRIWQVLCEAYFQRFVPLDATVLDLACGMGEFVRHIRAAKRIGVDVNPEMRQSLPADVQFLASSAESVPAIESGSIDVCFVSNFFEHLESKAAMDRVLAEIRRMLKTGGRFICMQPNIRYAGGRYWDFYDHVLPLSHESAVEGLQKNGFRIDKVVPRFVPFSTKSALPKHPALVRMYLRLPVLWRLMGGQFVVVAHTA